MKNTWTWGIGGTSSEYYVYLEKGSLKEEIISAFAGWCFNQGWYWLHNIGNSLIFRAERVRKEVMRLPITYEQAVELGWELDDVEEG